MLCKRTTDLMGEYEEMPLSYHRHDAGRIAASNGLYKQCNWLRINFLLDIVFAHGASGNAENRAFTETLNIKGQYWRKEADYPYAKPPFMFSDVIALRDSFVVFAGLNDLTDARMGSSIVARFDTVSRSWSFLGNLKARVGKY